MSGWPLEATRALPWDGPSSVLSATAEVGGMNKQTRGLYKEFSSMTVSGLRALKDGEAALAAFLNLDTDAVTEEVEAAYGQTKLSTLFEESWPEAPTGFSRSDQDWIGEMTVAEAKDDNYECVLSDLWDLDLDDVHSALGTAHGNTKVANALLNAQEAQEAQEEDEEDEEEEEDEEDEEEGQDAPPSRPARQRRAAGHAAIPRVGALVVGRYQVDKVLGEGGFGRAYVANDRRSPGGARVVLKFPNEQGQEAILREFEKAIPLAHRNIVRYLHHDEDPGFGAFIVMQHGGRSLQAAYETEGMDLDGALDMVRQAATGLDYLHEEAVIHCDVNPGNVLVDDAGRVRLSDFGLARAYLNAVRTQGGKTTIATRGLSGAHHPVFSAPEMINGTPRRSSDQYSLALVFCACLLGMDTFYAEQRSKFARLDKAQNAALATALSHDFRERHATCSAFADALGCQPLRRS